ncbi:hypothetical protein RND71_041822 [Anisodus tanguticus]|uniref:DUF4283 domain-containing protein n=1 Tax=Anisodus tanguticus TaxID=243964 RepID=A0AAE1UX56_9SOLA|nr:hypothetical protein RND71_041822 [Anisodus tanguticus]
MEEEITDRLQKFVLTEEEKDAVEIDIPDIKTSLQDCEVSILDKIIADKEVSFQGVKNTMPMVWGNPLGLRIKKIEKNFFQFIFRNKESMNKVLFGTPWLFDMYLLNVHEWEPGLRGDSPVFNGATTYRKPVDDIEPIFYGNQQEVHIAASETVNQINDNMAVDSLLAVNNPAKEKMQQFDEEKEPVFDDTLAGREARELYILSKMGFGDTIEEGDFERYSERMAAASRQAEPANFLKIQQEESNVEKLSEQLKWNDVETLKNRETLISKLLEFTRNTKDSVSSISNEDRYMILAIERITRLSETKFMEMYNNMDEKYNYES